jgi:uncharacterized protein (TIGR03067 family)
MRGFLLDLPVSARDNRSHQWRGRHPLPIGDRTGFTLLKEILMTARAVLPGVVILLIAAAMPAQDVKKELDSLQGEWTMVSLEQKGKVAPDEAVKQYKLTIKGSQWTVVSPAGQETSMTFKIDPSKDPKAMDLTIKLDEKEVVSLGIYKLQDDTLTLCRTAGKKERPKEFKTTAEAGILVVWKRAKQ